MQKEITLKRMGIQNWHQRVALPLAEQPVVAAKETPVEPQVLSKESVLCYCYQWKKSGNTVAYLLAQYDAGNADESNLVAAIAKAIALEHSGGCRELLISDCTGWNKPIFVLGSALFAQLGLSESSTVINAYSPQELLSNQSFKRETWNQLKQFSRLVS